MEQTAIKKFIDNLILSTNQKELHWKVISKDDSIHHLPGEEYICNSVPRRCYDLRYEYSFYAKYKTGSIIFLTYCDISTLPIDLPPRKSFFSLRFQDEYKRYATEVTNTSKNCDELIRIYNLLENEVSGTSPLIDDFLNSI